MEQDRRNLRKQGSEAGYSRDRYLSEEPDDRDQQRRRAYRARRRKKQRQQRMILLGIIAVLIIVVIICIVSCSKSGDKKTEDAQAGSTAETENQSAGTTETEFSNMAIDSSVKSVIFTALEKIDSSYTAENPKELVITDLNWPTLLINASHKVPDDYSAELMEVRVSLNEAYEDYNSTIFVDSRIVEPLKQMLEAMYQAGLSPVLVSSYRDNAYQESLIEENVGECLNNGMTLEEAKTQTGQTIAVPGCSEHNAGLAVDIVTEENTDVSEEIENTPEMKWLAQHCSEYGFIVRYPVEKSDITGIIYEPWHFRYVGTDLAGKITESGLCMEEYYAQHPEMKTLQGY